MYRKSVPMLSKNQELICVPRFCTDNVDSDDEDMLDIYDCSDESFWYSRDNIDPSDVEHYKCTLKMKDRDFESFKTVKFSTDNKYVAVLCEKKVMIYDLNQVGKENLAIQDEDELIYTGNVSNDSLLKYIGELSKVKT